MSTTLDTIRLGLHVTAGAVWVGGQFVLGGLVPVLRDVSPEAPKLAAQRFNLIAWSAYGLLLFTGIWNLLEVEFNVPHPFFEIKFGFYLLAGLGAALHIYAKGNKAMLALGGAFSSIGGIVALFMGVGMRFVPL